MTRQTFFRLISASMLFVTSAIFVAGSLVQTREQTTIQTVSVAVNGKTDAITVRYLNLPWGEKTFQYIEKGEDNYYGTRSWPFARMTTTIAVKYGAQDLSPGAYALVLNPAKKGQALTLTILKLADDKEFLQPGNIFVEVPGGKQVVTVPVSFESSDKAAADHL